MRGRRGAVDWTSAPDEGDAATAAREIGGWRAEPRRARNWDALLPQIRDRLLQIAVNPLVRGDPECRAILDALRADGGAAALDEAMRRLSARVDALLGAAPTVRAVAPPLLAPPPVEEPAPPARRRLFRL